MDFKNIIKDIRTGGIDGPKGIDFDRLERDMAQKKQDDEELDRIIGGDSAQGSDPETEPPIKLSDEQERVWDRVEEGKHMLITGGAGVGKSTLIKEIDRRLGGQLELTGSTGISAVQIGGVTLHSWAGLGLGEDPAKKIASIIFNRVDVCQRLKQTKRVVIDEISMISSDLLDKLSEVLSIVRKNEAPFGGMQIIACGDYLQLPPVTRGENKKGRFAFQSKAWKAAGFNVALLQKVFRQADAEFAAALNDIRVGNLSERAGKMLMSRLKQPDPNPEKEPITIYTTNKDVDALNAAKLEALPGEQKQWKAFDTGEPAQVTLLQKHCMAPEVLTLKVGARVMLLKNISVSGGLANGSMGKVIALDKPDGPTVEFDNGAKMVLPRGKWDIKVDGKIVATRHQIPLRLAFSITSHKSQGMSLDKIRVNLANVFEDGQAYVALSRARTKEGLFIESSAAGCIRANAEAVEFYRRAME